MPRRNLPPRCARGDRGAPAPQQLEVPATTDEMARSLVLRGLAGPVILGPLIRPWTTRTGNADQSPKTGGTP
jgi:hypothetical protein